MKLNLSKLDQVKMKYNSFGLGVIFATMDFADCYFFAAIANLVIESWRKFQNKRESKQKKSVWTPNAKKLQRRQSRLKIFFKWKYAGVSFKWKDICLVERNVTLKIVHPYGVTLIFFLFLADCPYKTFIILVRWGIMCLISIFIVVTFVSGSRSMTAMLEDVTI